jgi:hypothetical protein
MNRIIILIFLCIMPQLAGAGEYYYVNTYELTSGQNRESSGNALYLKTINLDTKSIVDSIMQQNRGYIDNGMPVILTVDSTRYIISFSEIGIWAKNGNLGVLPDVFYTICKIDSGIPEVAKFDSVQGAWIEECEQSFNENKFRFSLRNALDTTHVLRPGEYSIDSELNLVFLDTLNLFDDQEIKIEPFSFLLKIPGNTKHNLYYGMKNSQYWLAICDSTTQTISNSVQLRFSGGAATLFAYHPKRDLFYCLKVNYEIPSDEPDFKPKKRLDYYIDPEVVIYDPESLDIIKRIPIADYPDGEYPGKENGLADVVGDYIVYFFFREEHYTRYDPAMLFIFDTRTNEATWLRVGWR